MTELDMESLARAVLDDLEDRRGIKQELLHCKYEDEEIYQEIKDAITDNILADIKRQGFKIERDSE